MKVKFMTVKGSTNIARSPYYIGIPQHERILSDEGASAYLMDTRGTVYPLVIDQVESDQLFRAHTAGFWGLVPGGS